MPNMNSISHRFDEDAELWRMVFEQSPIGIAFVGTNGEWLKVNRKICEIVEYSEAELTEKTFQDITHPEDLSPDVAMLDKLQKGDIDGYEMLKRYITKTNKLVWVRLTVWPVRGDDGDVIHYVSHIQPLLNGEKTKMESSSDGKIRVRPSISVGEFISDNWKSFIAASFVVITSMIVAGVAYWGAISKIDSLESAFDNQQKIIMELIKNDIGKGPQP